MSAALESYDSHAHFESCLSLLEKKVTEMQTAEKNLSEHVKNIEIQLKKYHNAVTNTDGSQPMNIPTPIMSPAPISEESVARLASSVVVEQREKEKRQLNIILHNLAESNAPEGTNRKEDDIKKCSSIFQTYLGSSADITNAIRLGKRSDKPRLLKITLNSAQEKSLILKNKLKLRSSGNPDHIRKLFITPDLTPGEQK